MSLIADEVAQVAMLHVGQNHQWWTLWRQADSQQRENIRMAEVLHDDPLFQELGHLFQICNAFIKNKQTILEMKRMGCSSASKRLEGLVMLGIYF